MTLALRTKLDYLKYKYLLWGVQQPHPCLPMPGWEPYAEFYSCPFPSSWQCFEGGGKLSPRPRRAVILCISTRHVSLWMFPINLLALRAVVHEYEFWPRPHPSSLHARPISLPSRNTTLLTSSLTWQVSLCLYVCPILCFFSWKKKKCHCPSSTSLTLELEAVPTSLFAPGPYLSLC